jgi:hypothetical protein
MRTTAIIILAVVLGIGSTACKKDKTEDKASTTAAGSAAMGAGGSDMGSAAMGSGAGSDMAAVGSAGSAAMGSAGSAAMGSAGSGAASDEPEMAKKAGNCPSTVFGAVTKAEVKGKDVVLTITAEDKDAVAAIQKRAEALVKDKKAATAGTAHDQKGTHGGNIGLCPVYYGEGGIAKVKKDAKGVTITITPKDKADELKANIDERIKKAAEWVDKNIKPGAEGNKGAVGGGKGAHGSTHQGEGDSKGKERKGGTGGGAGTGGGGGKGTGGGGTGTGDAKKGG